MNRRKASSDAGSKWLMRKRNICWLPTHYFSRDKPCFCSSSNYYLGATFSSSQLVHRPCTGHIMLNPFLTTVPTFAVRETDVSRHNGDTRGSPTMPRDVSLSDSKCWNGGQNGLRHTAGIPRYEHYSIGTKHYT